MKIVNVKDVTPKVGMKRLRELAKTKGRDSDEYKQAVKDMARQMTQASSKTKPDK